jgi:hypothetical protein
MGFAATNHPVEANQILISEPNSERITNDKQVVVMVNITNLDVDLTDKPIILSIVKIENKLPFVNELGSDLNVSVMKLSSGAVGELDRTVQYNTSYSTASPSYSEDYSTEIKVINRFFEVKDLILSHNYEIATINKIYRFDLIVGNEEAISKLTEEAKKDFTKWTNLKSALVDLKKEYATLQVQYSKLFEKQIISDKIDRLSYSKLIGKLNNGTYKVRFLDEASQLIKEFTFEVVDREGSIIQLEPLTTTKTN